jgi:hypothetical protein
MRGTARAQFQCSPSRTPKSTHPAPSVRSLADKPKRDPSVRSLPASGQAGSQTFWGLRNWVERALASPHPSATKSRRSGNYPRPFAGVRAAPGFSSVEDGSRARSEENEPLIFCRNRSPFSNPLRRACALRRHARHLGPRQIARLRLSNQAMNCSKVTVRPALCAVARDQ